MTKLKAVLIQMRDGYMTDSDFEKTWNEIINRKITQLMRDYGDLVCLDSSKEEIKSHYLEIIQYTKNHYMTNSEGLLNRYKIAAAMMIAILKAKPIKKAAMKYYIEDSDKWIFNEQLALNTGLKIVRNFIITEISGAGGPKNLEEKILYYRFLESIPMVRKERESWEIELYYIRQEGAYSLLSLAHELEDFVQLVVARAMIKRMSRQLATLKKK